MALNIKNDDVERLVEEVVDITGETKTEAVRRALEERRARLGGGVHRSKRQRWIDFLEHDVWPTIPAAELGRQLTKEEIEAILGYGESGA